MFSGGSPVHTHASSMKCISLSCVFSSPHTPITPPFLHTRALAPRPYFSLHHRTLCPHPRRLLHGFAFGNGFPFPTKRTNTSFLYVHLFSCTASRLPVPNFYIRLLLPSQGLERFRTRLRFAPTAHIFLVCGRRTAQHVCGLRGADATPLGGPASPPLSCLSITAVFARRITPNSHALGRLRGCGHRNFCAHTYRRAS
jgi:hypothetical protein